MNRFKQWYSIATIASSVNNPWSSCDRPHVSIEEATWNVLHILQVIGLLEVSIGELSIMPNLIPIMLPPSLFKVYDTEHDLVLKSRSQRVGKCQYGQSLAIASRRRCRSERECGNFSFACIP